MTRTRSRLRTTAAVSLVVVAGAVAAPLVWPETVSTAHAQDTAGALPLHVAPRVFARAAGVDGEAQDPSREGWVELHTVEWGAARKRSKSGAVRRRGAAIVEDLTLTMEYEKSTPKLQEKLLQGEVIPNLEIHFTAQYGESRRSYLTYELTNVLLKSYSTNASGNDESGPPSGRFGLNFEQIAVSYTEHDQKGSSLGQVEFAYDASGRGR